MRTCADGQTKEIQQVGGGTPQDDFNIVCLGGQQVSIQARIERAFRQIPVPTPALHIQPVKGRTLVNLKTNFYATGGTPFTRTLTLLGHHVTLRIHVDHYDIDLGDGHHLTTTDPGASYPQLTNTHQYRRKGTVHPSMNATWTADYRIDNHPWQTVAGTVTKQGPPQALQVVEATPVLTDPYR